MSRVDMFIQFVSEVKCLVTGADPNRRRMLTFTATVKMESLGNYIASQEHTLKVRLKIGLRS